MSIHIAFTMKSLHTVNTAFAAGLIALLTAFAAAAGFSARRSDLRGLSSGINREGYGFRKAFKINLKKLCGRRYEKVFPESM